MSASVGQWFEQLTGTAVSAGTCRWLASLLLPVLLTAGCGAPPSTDATPSVSTQIATAPAVESGPSVAQEVATAGPEPKTMPKPGGGSIAEDADVEGNLTIEIRWSARIVTGDPDIGQTTTVYQRQAHLSCPVTSGAEATSSYFAAYDDPDGDPMAATGLYQPWWNEDCTGSLTLDDSYHANDLTLVGPEPVVRTTGTRPLSTSDTPLTVETDLYRARTRYMFVTPSTDGFQREAAEGYPAALVPASAAPMPTLDITREGPIGGGSHEIAVEGGVVQVSWTFSRGEAGS